jgi:cytochrome P450
VELSGPPLTPPRVPPMTRRLGRIGFLRAFSRNPLEILPAAAYEQDFFDGGNAKAPRVWVSAPALIKAVLLDERDKFRKIQQIKLLSPLLGKGVLTSEGADWKWQRQASAPMFKPQDLLGFVPAFVRAADATIGRWRAGPANTVHPIDEDMTKVTFDVIASTLLPSSDESFARTIQESILTLQRYGGWDIMYASLNVPRWVPKPGMYDEPRAVIRLRAAVMKLMRELREKRRTEGGPDDLMSRLIAARDPESGRAMDDEQLVDNLLTFYLAGHETTAKALTWTLYLLSRSPAWAGELVDEIARVTGGGPVRGEHIEKLVLTQQVIKESMRLYPPVPMMTRQAVADSRIGERAIPKGTSVLMSIYAIHRHAKRWERPHEFDPTRFAPSREASIPRYQYMPFGAGPRICIGMPFAMIEATAILATFLQHASFEWSGHEEPIPVARVTLIPKGGMPMRVTLRK